MCACSLLMWYLRCIGFSRWKRDKSGEKILRDGKPVLEFVAVKRKDTGEWALPGVRN